MYTMLVLSVILLTGSGVKEIAANVLPSMEPIVLDGQCDPNLPTVENFNMVAYGGIWYLVESYPSNRQIGGCNRARHVTTTSTNINLVNTRVYDQTLYSVYGFATHQGDGKFRATIGLPSTDISDYWVLATNYNSYALVYSCENIGDTQKRVNSWKLSRSDRLTAQDALAIDSKIREPAITAAGLDQSNYYEIDHSTEACFYHRISQPGPILHTGQCDQTIPVVPNLDFSKFAGTWRLIESYPTNHQAGSCNEVRYTSTGQGFFEVFNSAVIGQTLNTVTGYGFIQSSAKFLISYPELTSSVSSFWILATDYDSYALAYSCENINANEMRVFSWKLSRDNELSSEAVKAINTVIDETLVLDQRYFVPVFRTIDDCFYFPLQHPGLPVEFIGLCDTNIATVQDFDLEKYMGTWRLIESYASYFQSGGCNDATYTRLSDTEIKVFNRRVDHNILHTITGAGVVEGSGKFSIHFPTSSAEDPADYWVLDTDYESYALVYSCQNISAEKKIVHSWKLSRSDELPLHAQAAINAKMLEIRELDQRYFHVVDRSAEACFHLPEPQEGESVRIPGQCDPEIQTVQNFNLAVYMGSWHIIESYQGTKNPNCNDATYTYVSATSFEVIDSRVDNQTLHTVEGVATTQSTGKFTIDYGTAEAPSVVDYWVLDTDYESYAFVYSCENDGPEERIVSSWKLSRTNELSDEAHNAINNIINDIEVLDQRYFELVDRSYEACFYYPDPETDSYMVFNGQCDENIPVVQNFDVARYMGNWQLIESYPSPFVSDSCIRASYTLNQNNNIDLHYTRVSNEELLTNQGEAFVEGNGKLIFTFPTAQAPINYWILATDYVSFALAYSCQNINANKKIISSWKLSRNSELSITDHQFIESTILYIPVLNERYYKAVDQSDNGCFYYPEVEPETPVQFFGQCDSNINTVQNFNVSAYVGTWYQIEAYPTVGSSACAGIRYTLNEESENELNVEWWTNSDGKLNVIEGKASIDSDTAKLSILLQTVPENPTAATSTDLYILATDYTGYSLAYSCLNVNDEHKTVVAMKFSRERNLTSEANTAINTAMGQYRDIDQRYFYEMDHSDTCEYPSSSFLIRSSIIVTIACIFLQRLF